MGDCACQMDSSHFQWNGEGIAFAFLELTPVCNNLCVGCCNVFAQQRRLPPLNREKWEILITHLASRVKALKISGGEPTLHPDFAYLISFINSLGLPFRLLTNGRWIEPEQMRRLLRSMASAVTILVSLHGPDAPSHEAFSRVRGSFAETVTNIARLAEAGLRVSISTVLTRYNWGRVEEMVAMARSIGADHVVFNRYIGRPLPSLEPTSFQLAQAVQRVNELIARGMPVRWGTPLPRCTTSPVFTEGCLAGEAFLTVDPWGNMRPCNHAPYVVGNLLVQSFDEVWHSSDIEKWRVMIPEECTDCIVYERCRGGCRAEALLRSASSYSLQRKPHQDVQPFQRSVNPTCKFFTS